MAKKILGEEGAQALANKIKGNSPAIIPYTELAYGAVMVSLNDMLVAINEGRPMYIKFNPKSSLIPISYVRIEEGENVQHKVYFPWGVLICDTIYLDSNDEEWLNGTINRFKLED